MNNGLRTYGVFGRRPVATGRLLAVCCAVVLAGVGLAQAQSDTIREEVKKRPEPKLTKQPKLIKFVEARYPEALREKGLQGRVELQVTIDARGRVSRAEVLSAPDPLLGEAAQKAVRQFVFSPAEVDNKPAPVNVRYGYNFVLEAGFEPLLPDWARERPVSKTRDAVVGRVREQGTRLPVSGAVIAIADLGIEVRADGGGRFRIEEAPAGQYTVTAFAATHKRDAIPVLVKPGEQAQIEFYLEPLKQDPYVTVVRGKRRQTTVSRVTLRGRQLTTVPGTFGDPIRVVQNLPGVARAPFVGGALLIRGAAPGDSGSYLDGVRIPLLFHFFGGPSVLNPEFLERIDYYPGNVDVRFNRLIAGAVDVTTRDTFTQQLKGSVEVNLLNAAVFLNVPITSKVSIAGAVRRSYVDALLPPILDAADSGDTTVVPVYYDYQGRVDVKLDGGNRLWILGFGSDDRLELATDSSDSDDGLGIQLDTQVVFHRILAGWRQKFAGGRGTSLFSPYVGFNVTSFEAGAAAVDINSWAVGAREDIVYRVGKNLRLRTGLDAIIQWATFKADIPLPTPFRNPGAPPVIAAGTDPVDVTQTLGSVGAYVDAIWDITPRLQVIPGLRVDVFYFQDDNIRPTVDPRLTARYRLTKKLVLKGGAGLYSQAPSPAVSNNFTGNPNLLLEHAAQFSLGVERELFVPQLKLDVQGYFNYRYDNAVRTDEVIVGDDSVRELRYRSVGSGYSTGLEVMLKHEVTRYFYGWIAYTLSWANQQREADGAFDRFSFDQRHILTLVGSFRFGKGWETGLRFRLVTGRPETPVSRGIFDTDGGVYSQVSGDPFSETGPTFHQLDLRVQYTWLFKLWRLALYLDVQNIYNAENPEATLFDYRFRQSGPLRGLPILPTLGVKGSF